MLNSLLKFSDSFFFMKLSVCIFLEYASHLFDGLGPLVFIPVRWTYAGVGNKVISTLV